MGLIHAGPPRDLVLALRDSCGIEHFVESGTFLGQTAAWAAGQFRQVTTIEAAPKLFAQTSARYALQKNITFVLGDSRTELPRVLQEAGAPTLLWLDGHWSDGETFGAGMECPLLDELAAVAQSPHPHFVFIDDARLFAAPPPAPHDMSQWPTLDAVMDALRGGGRSPYIVYIEDVIVPSPQRRAAWWPPTVVGNRNRPGGSIWKSWLAGRPRREPAQGRRSEGTPTMRRGCRPP